MIEKNYLKVFGLGGLIGCTIMMYALFFTAYFNGYRVLLTINKYGEAHFEAIMLVLLFPAIFLFIKKQNAKNTM